MTCDLLEKTVFHMKNTVSKLTLWDNWDPLIGGVKVDWFGFRKVCFGGEIDQFFKSDIKNLEIVWDIFSSF